MSPKALRKLHRQIRNVERKYGFDPEQIDKAVAGQIDYLSDPRILLLKRDKQSLAA